MVLFSSGASLRISRFVSVRRRRAELLDDIHHGRRFMFLSPLPGVTYYSVFDSVTDYRARRFSIDAFRFSLSGPRHDGWRSQRKHRCAKPSLISSKRRRDFEQPHFASISSPLTVTISISMRLGLDDLFFDEVSPLTRPFSRRRLIKLF